MRRIYHAFVISVCTAVLVTSAAPAAADSYSRAVQVFRNSPQVQPFFDGLEGKGYMCSRRRQDKDCI